MGSAESKVAAQPPLGVVVSAGGVANNSQRPVVLCNFLRKQNKTVPVQATATAQPTPSSSPTIEAVKEAKKPSAISTTDTSAASGGGPPVQILLTNRALSLHQLGFEELSTQLLKAVKNGDQKLVERVAEISATKQLSIINIRGMWESTPLIYACQYCHESIALWLLQAGGNVHLVNEKGVTALLLASLEGMTAAVQQMILQLTDTTGGEEERIPVDAQVGVVYNSAVDLNVRANPLLGASMNGHVEVVLMLLQHGANVNCGVSTTGAKPTPSGSGGARGGGEGGNGALQFPLLVAAKYGHSAVVQLLIKKGASIPETDGNENHALLLACEAAKEDCALTLLRHLPVAEHAAWKRPNCHGFTALHYCAVHGLVKAAECMLLQLQWRDDPSFLNATSSTRHESAVLMASRKKQIEVAKLLIQCGADAMLADRGGTSALDVLKRDKRDEVMLLWQEQQQSRQQEKLGGQEKEELTETEMKEVLSAPEESAAEIKQLKMTEKELPVELSGEGVSEKKNAEANEMGFEAVQGARAQPQLSESALSDASQKQDVPPIVEAISTARDTPEATSRSRPATPVVEAPQTAETKETREFHENDAETPIPSASEPSLVVNTNESTGSQQGDIPRSDQLDGSIPTVPVVAVTVQIHQSTDVSGTMKPNEVASAAPQTPQRPSSSKPKSTPTKKTHNRRGTGHVSQDAASVKRLNSRVGTMSAIAMDGEDGEDSVDNEEPVEITAKVDAPSVSAGHSSLPWDGVTPLLNGAMSGTLEIASSPTGESKANDRTASVRVMTFSRDLAPVEAVPTGEDDGVHSATAVDERVPISTTASSSSPRKEREKHKKKKRHSRKKPAEGGDATSMKADSVAVSSSLVSQPQLPVETDQQRFASVRIPQREDDDKGALDDDF